MLLPLRLRAPLPQAPIAGLESQLTPQHSSAAIRQPTSSKTPHLARAAIMALPQSAYKDRQFLAVIGDEVRICVGPTKVHAPANAPQDSVTGILLAGVGVSARAERPLQFSWVD